MLNEKQEEQMVAIYNNSNEIFGISNKRILMPKCNARVSKSEAESLIKHYSHAIHYKMIEEFDTLSKFATQKDALEKKIAEQERIIEELKATKENDILSKKTASKIKDVE